MNLLINKFPLAISLFLGLVLGFLFIGLLPTAERNPIFLLAVPLLCALFLGVVLVPEAIIASLIFLRVLLDPLLNTTKVDGGLGFGAVLNLFVIIVTLYLVIRRPIYLFKTHFFKSWLFFLSLCGLAIAYSPVQMMGVKVFFNLVSYLCMAILPSLIHPERNDKKFWIKLLFISSLLPVLFANLDMLRGGRFYVDAGNRILGTFTHPNILAFYLVWLTALVLYILKSPSFSLSPLRKFFLWGYLANIFVLLIATKTRNAWIGCWLLFFLYGVFKEKKYIFVSVAVLLAASLSSDVASRMTGLFEANTSQLNSLAWRVEVWKSSLSWMAERWIFGYGLASFHDLSKLFLFTEKKGTQAHNTYLQLWFEVGLVGLTAYLLIYWNLLRAFFLRFRKSAGGLSAEFAIVMSYLIVYIASGFGDNMLHYLTLNWYCWFFVGIVLKAMQFQFFVRDVK